MHLLLRHSKLLKGLVLSACDIVMWVDKSAPPQSRQDLSD